MKLYELAETYALGTSTHYAYNKELIYNKASTAYNFYDIATETKKHTIYESLIDENKTYRYAYYIPASDFIIKDKLYCFTAQIYGFTTGLGSDSGVVNTELLCFNYKTNKFVKRLDEFKNFLGLTVIKKTRNKIRFFGIIKTKTEKDSAGKSIMHYQQVYVDADIDSEGNLYNITKTVNTAETHKVQYSTGKVLNLLFRGVVGDKIILYQADSALAFYADLNENVFQSKSGALTGIYLYSHNGEEKKFTTGTSLIFNDTNKSIKLNLANTLLQYSRIDNEIYLYGVCTVSSGVYVIRKYRIDLDNQEVELLEEIANAKYSNGTLYGYSGGGAIYHTSTRSYVTPYIIEEEEDKEKVTFKVPSKRAVSIDNEQVLNTVKMTSRNSNLNAKLNRAISVTNNIDIDTVRSAHINSKQQLKSYRQITNLDCNTEPLKRITVKSISETNKDMIRSIAANYVYELDTERSSHVNSKTKLKYYRQITKLDSNTGQSRREVIIKDNLLNYSCRAIVLNKSIEVDTIRSSHINSKSNLNVERKIVKLDCNTEQIERKVTVNTYKLNDSKRMVSKDVLLDRKTLRIITDLEVARLKAETSRKVIKEQQSLGPTARASVLNVESKLNSKRRISSSETQLVDTKRIATKDIEVINEYTNRAIVVAEEVSINTAKNIVAGRVAKANLNRRSIKQYDYDYSTERIILRNHSFIGYYPVSRTVAGNITSSFDSSRLISGPITRYFRTRRTISSANMDCALYIFNVKMFNSNIALE